MWVISPPQQDSILERRSDDPILSVHACLTHESCLRWILFPYFFLLIHLLEGRHPEGFHLVAEGQASTVLASAGVHVRDSWGQD